MRASWCNDFDLELASYFGGAYESALGLHAAGLEPSGQSDPSGKLPPATARSAHKDMTLVEAALARLSPDTVRVIALRYAPRKFSHFEGLSEFGEFARIALVTKTAIEIGDEWRGKALEAELTRLPADDTDGIASVRKRFDRAPQMGEIQEALRFLQRTRKSGTNGATIDKIVTEAKELWSLAKRQYAKARSGAAGAIDEDEMQTDVERFRRRLGL